MYNIETKASKALETILNSVSLAKAIGPKTRPWPLRFFLGSRKCFYLLGVFLVYVGSKDRVKYLLKYLTISNISVYEPKCLPIIV